MPNYSHRRHGPDKTVLSRPCWRCELNWRQDKTVFSNPRYTWDWTVANWKPGRDKTKLSSHRIFETGQNCIVLSPIIHFTPPTRTRQDKAVLSCPCRRCENRHNRMKMKLRRWLRHCCYLRLWQTNSRLPATSAAQYGPVSPHMPVLRRDGMQSFRENRFCLFDGWPHCNSCVPSPQPLQRQLFQIAAVRRVQRHTGLTHRF